MWDWLITSMAKNSLETLHWWAGLGAILLPVLGGISGWIAWEISGKVVKSKESEFAEWQTNLDAAQHEQRSKDLALLVETQKKLEEKINAEAEAKDALEKNAALLAETKKKLDDSTNYAKALEGKQRPRLISDEQKLVLAKLLKPVASNPVSVMHGSDPEQKQYADALVALMRGAGYIVEVKVSPAGGLMPYPAGLTFVVNSAPPYPPNAIGIQKSFDEVGIPQEWVARADYPRDVIFVYVGTKP